MSNRSSKALILSSGGVDSTVCVAIAVDKLGAENVSTVSVKYGQKHSKELECAAKVANFYHTGHYELDLSNIFKYSNCSLLKGSTDIIPEMSYAEQIEQNGKPSTEVPLRNGLMLVGIGSLAMQIYPEENVDIYIGAHADDAAGDAYPDCSEEFIRNIREAILIGSRNKVQIISPFVNCNKSEVVRIGLSMGAPFELTTSCYNGRDKACGLCGTCRDRIAAFKANNAVDPIEYEIDDPFKEIRRCSNGNVETCSTK